MNDTELDPKAVDEPQGIPQPYHRWRMNEDMGFNHLGADYCLACGVRRFSLDETATAKAQGPCPEGDYPVPGHINNVTGRFCSREGEMAPGGRCPDGCDHAPHYSNDGHPECAEEVKR